MHMGDDNYCFTIASQSRFEKELRTSAQKVCDSMQKAVATMSATSSETPGAGNNDRHPAPNSLEDCLHLFILAPSVGQRLLMIRAPLGPAC